MHMTTALFYPQKYDIYLLKIATNYLVGYMLVFNLSPELVRCLHQILRVETIFQNRWPPSPENKLILLALKYVEKALEDKKDRQARNVCRHKRWKSSQTLLPGVIWKGLPQLATSA